MKKIDFIEKIWIEMTAGAPSQENMDRYDLRHIASIINDPFNTCLFQIYAATKNQRGAKSFDALSKVYSDVPVLLDESRNEYYSDVPSCLASIPQDEAIREIRSMKDNKNSMIQIESNSLPIIAQTAAYSLMADMQLYYLDFNKVFYPRWDGFTKVLMRLVVPFSSYADTDEIPEPVGFKVSLFDMVIGTLKGTYPIKQDNKNDNA
jgi:hypothetical protein